MAHWRESVNPELKAHFERLVTKSAEHKESYEQAKHSAIAQLWTANAIQEKELDELRAKITLLERAIRILAEKGRVGEQTAMKTKFLEKALAEISGKRPEEVLENRRFSAPRDEVSMEKIDANKAMREVISRKAVVKETKNEAQKTKEAEIIDDETDDEEDEEDDEEPEEEKRAAGIVSCSCPNDEKILCRHEGMKKEPGYLYFISKEGNLGRVPMSRGAENEKFKQEILHRCNIKRESEWLYYVDKNMNAARAKMVRKNPEGKKESPAKLKKVLKKL